MAKKVTGKKGSGKKRHFASVPLTQEEYDLIEQLMCRYQAAVVTRNQEFKERCIANVTQCDIVRVSLAVLDSLEPEDLRLRVLASKDGRSQQQQTRSKDLDVAGPEAPTTEEDTHLNPDSRDAVLH